MTENPVLDPAADTAAALATYKRRVRRTAITVASQQNWCIDGLNETLASLDLAPFRLGSDLITVTGEVVVRDHDRDRAEPLTADTITPLIAAGSTDLDVKIVSAPRAVVAVRDGQDFTLTVTLTVKVINTHSRRVAEEWVTNAVQVQPYSDYLNLTSIRYSLRNASFDWGDTDPDVNAWDN